MKMTMKPEQAEQRGRRGTRAAGSGPGSSSRPWPRCAQRAGRRMRGPAPRRCHGSRMSHARAVRSRPSAPSTRFAIHIASHARQQQPVRQLLAADQAHVVEQEERRSTRTPPPDPRAARACRSAHRSARTRRTPPAARTSCGSRPTGRRRGAAARSRSMRHRFGVHARASDSSARGRRAGRCAGDTRRQRAAPMRVAHGARSGASAATDRFGHARRRRSAGGGSRASGRSPASTSLALDEQLRRALLAVAARARARCARACPPAPWMLMVCLRNTQPVVRRDPPCSSGGISWISPSSSSSTAVRAVGRVA